MRLSVLLRPPGRPLTPVEIAVVVDALRAGASLAAAAAHGVGRIRMAETPEQGLALRARLPAGTLLGGERRSQRPEGFDVGNSPRDYADARLRGRDLVFTSTNGSRAARRAGGRRTWMGAFVNGAVLVEALRRAAEVRIVCAGEQGGFSLEDAACAGWLAARLRSAAPHCRLEAGGRAALALAPRDAAEVRALLVASEHGRALRALGADFAADVEDCARLDAFDRVAAVEVGEP
jgi:2-phosphosulfolactate phosphatase